MNRILFFSSNKPSGDISYSGRLPIEPSGRLQLTCEHYFQTQKLTGMAQAEVVGIQSTPMSAARLGELLGEFSEAFLGGA